MIYKCSEKALDDVYKRLERAYNLSKQGDSDFILLDECCLYKLYIKKHAIFNKDYPVYSANIYLINKTKRTIIFAESNYKTLVARAYKTIKAHLCNFLTDIQLTKP